MKACYFLANEPVPAVEILVQKQILRAAVHALRNDPQKELPVDFGNARNNLAIPLVGRPCVLHLKYIAPAWALDMPSILMLLGFCSLRDRASSQVMGVGIT